MATRKKKKSKKKPMVFGQRLVDSPKIHRDRKKKDKVKPIT